MLAPTDSKRLEIFVGLPYSAQLVQPSVHVEGRCVLV